jgi:predicted CoA-substrate-specific enzyme activase
MYSIGVDIGSTCAKVAVLEQDGALLHHMVIATGWSSGNAAEVIRAQLLETGYDVLGAPCVGTGYGRLNIPYADKTITEITCHGKGSAYLFGPGPAVVIDIGGQDTKIIAVDNGAVQDFLMNDKCSAGTGRFLEVMANTLAMEPGHLCELARHGSHVTISSMCTVFAESEVISLIGSGAAKEDIAFGIVDSICTKVASQFSRLTAANSSSCYLTGGLCESPFILELLSQKIGRKVQSQSLARYAGAIGAAQFAQKIKK